MTRRFWILPAMTGLLLSCVYLLPKGGEMAPSAISMRLPEVQGDWILHHRPPSREEIELLAEDTKFSKAICLQPRPGEYHLESGMQVPDRVDLSVVLSGHDLNNSIHRPERCMPSQGHVIGSSSKVLIDLPNGRQLPTRRLLSVQSVPINEEHTEYQSYQCLTYYFFVGHRALTEDHLERTLIDIKDRLLFGMDQRWAYVSVSMWYDNVPWIEPVVTIEEADRKLQEFLRDLSMSQIDWDQIGD